MAGVKIEDATLLQTIDGNVSIPVQQQGGTTAERITTGQMRQYVADNTNVSDLQGSSDYARVSDIPTKTSQLLNDGADNTSTYVEHDELAEVATSGDYNDLLNKPTIPAAQVQADWNEADSTAVDYIKNKPNIPSTANCYETTDTNENDIDDSDKVPFYDTSATGKRSTLWSNIKAKLKAYFDGFYLTQHQDISGKADKVSSATNGDLAGLDSNGNLTDSGITATSVSTAVTNSHTHSNKALLDTYSQTEANLADAVSKKHSHSNKTLLDLLPSTLGTAGQVPTVNSGATGIEWQTPSGGSATDVQVNGTSITSGGVANIVTETAYNASTNKIATVGDLPSVPTISTDIDTDKTSTTKTASPSAVYNEVHPATASSQPVGGMLPNKLYKLGTLSGSVSIALASPSDNTIANHYYFTFIADSTAPTITWDASITSWNGGSAPTITASKHYEVSVLDGVATFMEV